MAQRYGHYDEVAFILVGGEYRIGLQDGYQTLDFLEERGVKFRWQPDREIISPTHLANNRKDQLIRACSPFIN